MRFIPSRRKDCFPCASSRTRPQGRVSDNVRIRRPRGDIASRKE